MERGPILVALDPRGCAHHVAETAAELAADLSAPAVLMTCVQLPDGVAPDTVITEGKLAGKTALQALHSDADEALAALRYAFDRRNVDVSLQVVVGDPAQTVVEMAHGARMVVVGTHGRTGLSRLLFGSVAEAIVRGSPVPVLTVRSEGAGIHPSAVQSDVGALADG